MLLNVLGAVSGVSLLLAAIFSGALLGPGEMRNRIYTEDREERAWRSRAAGICLLVGLLAGLLTYLVYRLG